MKSYSLTPCLSAISLAILMLAGCGGGGTSATNAKAQGIKTVQFPKTYAAGRIAGFGSIVINGVHYDETNATVTDEDGVAHPTSDLKLGMVAEVQAIDFGTVDNSGNSATNQTVATATAIVIKSLMLGAVTAVDPVAGTLTVLGQTVSVLRSTTFDLSLPGGLATIKIGDAVKIYGLPPTATTGYVATRIEPAANPGVYALRGLITTYDPVAMTLTIGNAKFDVSAASFQDTPAVGALVRLIVKPLQVNGVWVAVAEKSGADQPQDNDHTELEGSITAFTSSTSFSVDGVLVDATKVTLPSNVQLALGSRVQVAGAVVKGVLVATSVTVESDQSIDSQDLEVEGEVTAIDTTKSTLTVHGATISFTSAVPVDGGALADIKVGSMLEVHGALAADGTTVTAASIRIDN